VGAWVCGKRQQYSTVFLKLFIFLLFSFVSGPSLCALCRGCVGVREETTVQYSILKVIYFFALSLLFRGRPCVPCAGGAWVCGKRQQYSTVFLKLLFIFFALSFVSGPSLCALCRGCVGVRGALLPQGHESSELKTPQSSTVQYSTIQYSTVQYSTVQYSTVLLSYSWRPCVPCAGGAWVCGKLFSLKAMRVAAPVGGSDFGLFLQASQVQYSKHVLESYTVLCCTGFGATARSYTNTRAALF